MNRSAILLVGGMGTRLHPITRNIPKPMLEVAGVPFTEHQIIKAREAGLTEIVLATSFKAELFEPYFGDGAKFGIKMRYAVETQPLGTAGAIRNAADKLTGSGPVAIFNGDVLSGHDLVRQFETHQANSADVTLHLTKVADARAFGAVELTSDGRVSAFNEKMANPKTNTINAGCYIFNRAIIEEIPHGQVVSVEREIFPKLLARSARVFSFMDESYWLDIGTPQALLKASTDLISGAAYSAATPECSADFLALAGAQISPTAKVGGNSIIGRKTIVGESAEIFGSVIGDDAEVGARSKLTNCFVAQGFKVPIGVIADGNFFGY
jgi:mannose-1-phosphate guanylyltransferase